MVQPPGAGRALSGRPRRESHVRGEPRGGGIRDRTVAGREVRLHDRTPVRLLPQPTETYARKPPEPAIRDRRFRQQGLDKEREEHRPAVQLHHDPERQLQLQRG